MEQALWIYNTLSRRKEVFKPLHAPNVGMYVCGPTVYGDPHLGHARPAITFDILFRYLKHLGYKVRYVRNITDVGHLEHDAMRYVRANVEGGVEMGFKAKDAQKIVLQTIKGAVELLQETGLPLQGDHGYGLEGKGSGCKYYGCCILGCCG